MTNLPSVDAVLVSWVSVNHGAAPLLSALDDGSSPLRARVRRLYLCSRDAPSPEGDRERLALRDTVTDLRERLAPICPEIVKLNWKTDASPTDHAAIRVFAEAALKRARDENPDALVAIHLSPGTPAMHAVWLVLGSTGFIAPPVALLQTADDRGKAAGQPAVQFIRFDLDTWLRRYRTSHPRRTSSEDDGRMWDPARAKSPALRDALAKMLDWAPLRVPVLLLGERGTGKSTWANFLRAMSPFQNAKATAWPTVVCGQFRVNPELARSELFGHARGAFTGAVEHREGLLEQANGDTLFFDEIGDIDFGTQRLLMAALDGRGFQRLGEAKVRQSNFRLVSATNRPLAMLNRDLLDADFFDRIAVFILEVPPLRQCPDDLGDAWRRVLLAATTSAGLKPDGWQHFLDSSQLLAALASHPLPGNFRDLQRAAFHVLAGLHAGRTESAIIAAAVASLGTDSDAGRMVPDTAGIAQRLPVPDLRAQVDGYERAWLEAAMQKAAGNKSEAARLVGMPRKTFEHRLQAVVRDRIGGSEQ